MFRCKACSSEVPNARERRSLQVETSANVRDTLEQLCCIRGCQESVVRQHCCSGYVCKKCFVLVEKYNRLQTDLKEVHKALLDNISVVLSVFPLETQQASSGSEQHPLLQEVNIRPPKRPARQSAAPQPKRTCLFSSSPTHVRVRFIIQCVYIF